MRRPRSDFPDQASGLDLVPARLFAVFRVLIWRYSRIFSRRRRRFFLLGTCRDQQRCRQKGGGRLQSVHESSPRFVLAGQKSVRDLASLIEANAREQPGKARVLANGVEQRIVTKVNEPGITDLARLL